ncbi:uncharacterized protein GVI51_F06017 [Nakaseomyces glabratus]|uniref:tRNA-splicing endonuclease subunit Sen15 domain-containing protein n=2 Tax=Candida glabrata TaxID=5478 RepID=Q6FU47_CANGA|nr:uncharacterized protein CAGL0F06435g [Nakaseomyces glabratus]KAH7587737.1 Sen15 protein [Nakaseomyces glabratus]KAH7604220.1 Sen15 protein [Nakaseomyces glabratus]KAH7605206.1 Sen15 protein [Nakaseomyces glabratus]KAH7607136.1 Sen15 protein [Nakaseomyces glabratus]KAH7614213.1 Sen15 protein [Nakaseomyces glabratus]|eukprot:XP_446247.1 uncharacterized protein CAGL0F06435g [[Candida] glabrata]
MSNLTERVRDNLLHFHLWTEVEEVPKQLNWKDDRIINILVGRPPHKLSNDDDEEQEGDCKRAKKEYILPVEMSMYKEGYLTLELLDKIFDDLCAASTQRLLLGIVNDDGTVLYYFAHKGIYKPKKN